MGERGKKTTATALCPKKKDWRGNNNDRCVVVSSLFFFFVFDLFTESHPSLQHMDHLTIYLFICGKIQLNSKLLPTSDAASNARFNING